MHDPFQTHANFGQYYGLPNPIGLPYQALQGSAINPTLNPLAAVLGMSQAPIGGLAQLGQSQFGQYPGQVPQQFQQQLLQQQLQQLQLAALQNPLLAALINNPLISAGLHQSSLGVYQGQPFGVQGQPFGVQGQPFGQQQHGQYPQIGQFGSPFGQTGYPLAPQSWIGQGNPYGASQGFGASQPFPSQWGPRPFPGQVPSPWGY